MDNKILPTFYSGKELKDKMEILPEYRAEQRLLPTQQRLMLLDSLYEMYVPTEMSYEIYSKLYVALSRSLNKKLSLEAMRQRNENHRAILRKKSNGLIGGSDSILITGTAGIGKSSAIENAVRVLSGGVIDTGETKIIPILVVQCPFDCSVKSLLIDIVRNVDIILGTDYFRFIHTRAQTIDTLIGIVSQITLNHIGVLIMDEIQNIVKNKHGINLIGALTQLINSSGTSIVMVGTPESKSFFEKEEYFARRAMGMDYDKKGYNDEFINFVSIASKYIYTKQKVELDESDYVWIYEHTKGLPSNVITLFHDAQEIAIIRNIDKFDRKSLEAAYSARMGMLHTYIESVASTSSRKGRTISHRSKGDNTGADAASLSFAEMVRTGGKDVISSIQKYVEVEEV